MNAVGLKKDNLLVTTAPDTDNGRTYEVYTKPLTEI
jgi:hypothetical protein